MLINADYAEICRLLCMLISGYLSGAQQDQNTVKLQPENIGRPPPLPEPVTGGGGTLVHTGGIESCQGLRAAPDSIANNLTIGIPGTHPQISKTEHRSCLDMTGYGVLVFQEHWLYYITFSALDVG